jgi:hypothetical protein
MKMPFVEAIFYATKNQSIVRCKVCTKIKRKTRVLVPKWDSLEKHAGKKIIKKVPSMIWIPPLKH